MGTADSYGRLGYQGLIAWPERLQREAPLLQRVLVTAPSRRILDLGCGSESPLELVAAQDVPLRGWRRTEVEALLGGAGFRVKEVLGAMTGESWTAASSDLVLVSVLA